MTHPSRVFIGGLGLFLSAMTISVVLFLDLLRNAHDLKAYLDRELFSQQESSSACEIEIHFFTFHWNQPAFLEAWARHHSSILGSLGKNRKEILSSNYRNLHVIDHRSTNLYALDVLARIKRQGAEIRHFSGRFTEKGRALSGWMREFRNGPSSGKSRRSTFLIPLDVDEFFSPGRYFCSEIQLISSPKIYQMAWKPFRPFVHSHQSVDHQSARLQRCQAVESSHELCLNTASAGRIKMNSYVPKMWQWHSPRVDNLGGKAYVELIRPKYDDFASSRRMRALRNADIKTDSKFRDDNHRNYSRKTLFSSKYFLATDQGNHHGFVASDHLKFLLRNPEMRNKNSRTSFQSEILHMSLLSWHGFQSKILRAKEEYDFWFRLTRIGLCTGNGRHMCLEYMYFLHNGLISWKNKYVQKAITKYW